MSYFIRKFNPPPITIITLAPYNMNFPKYTREERLDTKLSESDIKGIRLLISKGHPQRYVAKVYGISQSTVGYWLLSPEERKERERIKP